MAKLSEIWEKIEGKLAYAILIILLSSEVVAAVLPDGTFRGADSARIILLSLALLFFFKSIDKQLSVVRGTVMATTFTDGFGRVMDLSGKQSTLCIVANDGLKYYATMSELDQHIGSVRLILSDVAHEAKWYALVERGCIEELEIRSTSRRPTFHVGIVDSRAMIIGGFASHRGGYSPRSNTFVAANTTGTSELLKGMQIVFDQMWAEAEAANEGNINPDYRTPPLQLGPTPGLSAPTE